MNIGDKVRFLNSVGGGKITGFQGNDIVLVEDESGFEVPCMKNEVVVIETDQYNFVRPNRTKSKEIPVPTEQPSSLKAALSAHAANHPNNDDEETDIADLPMTFHARPLERRGGDSLNVYLGFLPVDIKELTDTSFEAYFINDCNFYIRYMILTQEGTAYSVRHEGVAEPNKKVYLETFHRQALPEFERMTVQMMAYKVDKPFQLKQPFCVTLRLDGTKFYKLHTFQPSEFFDEASLVYELIRDDQPARNVFVDADQIKEAILGPKEERPKVTPARKEGALPGFRGTDRNGIIEIDLHVEKLLDNTSGMDAKAILDYQLKMVRKTMEAHLKEKGRRIVFIHGKGDGVLRNAILKQLKTQYRNCTHQDASFQEYGFGATMVTIH